MLERQLSNFLLILLLTCSQLVFAQESQESKSRDLLVKESIAKLDSNDIHVAAQAAADLGGYRATEAVPAMLRVLQSSRLLSTSEHIVAKEKNSMSLWVSTDVRAAIINSLGLIGDKRAVPVLRKYLRNNSEVFSGNVAHALYQITGESYEYKDYDGVKKLYVPSPITEEEFRTRSRPDLQATEGLTASLEIEGHDPNGVYWVADRPLVINLALTNQSERVIEIDAAADNFLFSTVAGSGERKTTLASLLPSPEPGAALVAIEPGQKLRLRWVVERLQESPLSRGWSGYVNIKCVYTNPRKNMRGAMWRGERLISNSVERYYYPPSNQSLDASRGSVFPMKLL
jgi:hypothetical protein